MTNDRSNLPASHEMPTRGRSRWSARVLAATVGVAVLTACGPTEPASSPLSIDSLTVTPLETAGTFRVVAHRWMTACQSSVTVERATRQDSLLRRFVLTVGRDPDIACPAAPYPLSFADTVNVSSGRSAVYVVRQPDGSNLVERLTSP